MPAFPGIRNSEAHDSTVLSAYSSIDSKMKKLYLRFCIIQASYWSFFAALPAYLTARMLDRGMNPSTLGILVSVYMGCSFVGTIFWSRFVDRFRAAKKFVISGLIASASLSLLVYLSAGRTALLFIIYPLLGLIMSAIPTNIDSWVIAVTGQVEAGSKTRSFGALAYAFVILACGQLISRVGYGPLPFISFTFAGILLASAFLQPELPSAAEVLSRIPSHYLRRHRTSARNNSHVSGRASGSGSTPAASEPPRSGAPAAPATAAGLFRIPEFVLLVFMVFITGTAVSPINSMKLPIFEEIGSGVAMLGVDSFIGCMIQAPLLILSGRLRRFRAEYRLIGAAFFMLLYAVLVMIARHPAVVVAGTFMMNAGFGLLLSTMREMTERSVDHALRTTANSITDVAYGSVSGMIASLWSGFVIEGHGKAALGGLSAGLQCLALLIAVVIMIRSRRSTPDIRKA